MELLFKLFYHPFFLVSNQSSDDDDLLTCLVFFLTKFFLRNDPKSDKILIIQWYAKCAMCSELSELDE